MNRFCDANRMDFGASDRTEGLPPSVLEFLRDLDDLDAEKLEEEGRECEGAVAKSAPGVPW
eukprot:SAG11_NODE_263_length_11526_cov_23.830314_9_plen_61_part_00